MKKIFAVFFLLTFLFLNHTNAHATVGPLVSEVSIVVNGERYELWAVGDDMTLHSFRLNDLAYILNGTPAQFNIREIDDDGIDFWIVRGEAYTPTGEEFLPIDAFYEDGEGDLAWFPGDFHHAIIGFDGTDYPETFIARTSYKDDDGFYFSLYGLASALGYSVEWNRLHDFNWEIGYENYSHFPSFVIRITYPEALPSHTPESLELIFRLDSTWVDVSHYNSLVIDESIVWPLEFRIQWYDNSIVNSSWNSVAPTRNENVDSVTHPLSVNSLEDGIYELTAPGQRILVDANAEEIDELIYYIDGRRYDMVRRRGDFHSRRYYAEPADGGGIKLLYIIRRQINFSENTQLTVYRSTTRGQMGTPIYVQDDIIHRDKILYEFTDTTAERGNIYYYTLELMTDMTWQWHEKIYFSEHEWQMTVDTNAILGAEIIESPATEPDSEPDITRGTLEGDIIPGKITFFRLQSGADTKLKAYIAQGEVL
ncbi:MAG: hypothetical protein LBI27_10465, partial [Clostridiales bacterium]|nr:hypothetical protein [Clostridiales bacterium]